MDEVVNANLLKIFAGKKVLVTGDTGFKGSWLSLWLHELGAKVLGYALPPERDNDHFCLLGLDEIISHVDGDIRDLSFLTSIFTEFKPEFVFHLAAQSLVRLSYEEPKLTFDTNTGGSNNILEVVRKCPYVKALVYVTTDKCYWNREWIWGYRENDELGGRDPYSASKAAAEMIFTAYMHSFLSERVGFGGASVRAGNVIGGGDWSDDRIVPDCIRALMDRRTIVLRNPLAIRPWQHVLEPLYGYLLLAVKLYQEPEKYSGAWNFGPRGEATRNVEELARTITKLWGEGEVQTENNQNAPYEASLLHLNCDKANHILGWHPCWDFSRCLEETVDWYRKVANGIPTAEISRVQIHNYCASQQLSFLEV